MTGPRCYITDCGNKATLIIPAAPDPVVLCDEHRWIVEGNQLRRLQAAYDAAHEAAAAAGVPHAVTLADASSDRGQGIVACPAMGLFEAAGTDASFPWPVATRPDLYDPAALVAWHRPPVRQRRLPRPSVSVVGGALAGAVLYGARVVPAGATAGFVVGVAALAVVAGRVQRAVRRAGRAPSDAAAGAELDGETTW